MQTDGGVVVWSPGKQQASVIFNTDIETCKDLNKPLGNFELSLAAWSVAYAISALLSAGLLSDYQRGDEIMKISQRVGEILREGMLK